MTSRKITNLVPASREFKVDNALALKVDLNQSYRDLSQAVNARTIGQYSKQSSALTGNTYYNFAPSPKNTYRLYATANSIASGTTVISTGIVNANNIRTVSLTGAATDNLTLVSLPLPYINVAAPADSITLRVNGNNFELITTTANYATYSAVIVWEFFYL